MASFVDEAIETLKQALSLHLFLYFFLIQILESVLSFAVLAVFALIGIAALFPYLGQLSFEGILGIFSNPANLLPIIAIVAVLAIIFLIVLFYTAMLFSGIRLHFFNNFAERKELSIGKAFAQARKRAFTCFKLELLVFLAIIAILAIIFVIMLAPLLSIKIGGSGAMPAAAIFGLIAGLFLLLVFFLGIFFLSPFLWLFQSVVFFEEKGVIGSIKRSVALVKQNYWGNLGFIVIFIVVIFVINLIASTISNFIASLFFFPAILAASTMAEEAAIYSMFSAMPSIFAVSFIIYLPLTLWMTVYNSASIRNLYFLNLQETEGSAKRRKK